MPRTRLGSAVQLAAAALATGLLLLPVSVAAQEVCVECSGPSTTYKCSVKDSERLGHSRNAGRAVEYVCITELAKAGGHQKCRANRNFTGPCVGEARLLDLGKSDVQSAAVPGAAATGDAGSTPADVPKPAADQPPQTLEELARLTVEKSKQQLGETDQKMKDAAKSAGDELEKAGSAVGGAVKKSVECVVSLFKNC